MPVAMGKCTVIPFPELFVNQKLEQLQGSLPMSVQIRFQCYQRAASCS